MGTYRILSSAFNKQPEYGVETNACSRAVDKASLLRSKSTSIVNRTFECAPGGSVAADSFR